MENAINCPMDLSALPADDPEMFRRVWGRVMPEPGEGVPITVEGVLQGGDLPCSCPRSAREDETAAPSAPAGLGAAPCPHRGSDFPDAGDIPRLGPASAGYGGRLQRQITDALECWQLYLQLARRSAAPARPDPASAAQPGMPYGGIVRQKRSGIGELSGVVLKPKLVKPLFPKEAARAGLEAAVECGEGKVPKIIRGGERIVALSGVTYRKPVQRVSLCRNTFSSAEDIRLHTVITSDIAGRGAIWKDRQNQYVLSIRLFRCRKNTGAGENVLPDALSDALRRLLCIGNAARRSVRIHAENKPSASAVGKGADALQPTLRMRRSGFGIKLGRVLFPGLHIGHAAHLLFLNSFLKYKSRFFSSLPVPRSNGSGRRVFRGRSG